MISTRRNSHLAFLCALSMVVPAIFPTSLFAHGTTVSPVSRVYNVFQANPDNPSFALAANAVAMDGTLSYYTWNELSRNIPEAVTAGLPAGFDYSPWVPDGELASGGRTDPNSPDYPRTYAGLDQVSSDWPTTPVTAGETILVDFLATAPHDPSVWDVWMTTPDWTPDTPLNWAQMEFLGRPQVVLDAGSYTFDLTIPGDRTGHHVLWIAWHRDDPVGEVFFATSDLMIAPDPSVMFVRGDATQDGMVNIADAIASLDHLFGGAAVDCEDALDVNDDGALDISDPISALAFLFSGGAPPLAPFPDCGDDPTADSVSCAAGPAC